MNKTTTLAAPTRRLLAGLVLTATAAVSAGASALTAGATGPADEPTTTAATVEDVTVARPAATASDLVPTATRPIVFAGPYPWPWITVGAATRPIVVADAYNGVGFTVCRNGTDPIVVADAYHGIGVVVCR